jgi:hypothetical protein
MNEQCQTLETLENMFNKFVSVALVMLYQMVK